jgi:hypothetical protein
MAISLRIPVRTEALIKKYAEKNGKTKTSVILEAIDAKLGLKKDRKQFIRGFAGWMSHDEAQDLRNSLQVFDRVEEEDWE